MTKRTKHTEDVQTYTVGDLRQVPAGTIQFCPMCMGEYSANHGDYFMLGDETELTCCGQPIELVKPARIMTPITVKR